MKQMEYNIEQVKKLVDNLKYEIINEIVKIVDIVGQINLFKISDSKIKMIHYEDFNNSYILGEIKSVYKVDRHTLLQVDVSIGDDVYPYYADDLEISVLIQLYESIGDSQIINRSIAIGQILE